MKTPRKRTARIVLKVTVEDYTHAELVAAGAYSALGKPYEDETEEEGVMEIEACDLAEFMAEGIMDNDELFAGTGHFVHLRSVVYEDAEWLDEVSSIAVELDLKHLGAQKDKAGRWSHDDFEDQGHNEEPADYLSRLKEFVK